ncbi:MAG: DUF4215 domain-containing protein [Deltaproteobacteria bacterium]
MEVKRCAFVFAISAFAPSAAWAVCGDGVQDAVEDCDDGNVVGGDGCSALCFDEVGRTDHTEQPGFWMWAPPYDYTFFATVDDDPTTTWRQPTNQGLWINLDIANGTPGPSPIDAYTITNGSNGDDPRGWVLAASVDGASWDVLDQQSNVTFAYGRESLTFPVTNVGAAYAFFNLSFTDYATADLEIAEVELIEHTGPVCGNGAVEAGEGCDDGNSNTEVCSYGQLSCTVCDATCNNVSGATTYCGDGATNGPEQCDDGNTMTELCAYGQTSCTVCNATCVSAAGATAYCGDNTINGPEQCDDGNTTTEVCSYGETSCTVCDGSCANVAGATSFCGDGVTNGPEQCDDGNTTTEVCSYGEASCTVCDGSCANAAGATSFCGDGVTNGPEQCDDGNTVTEACAYGQTSCTVCDATCVNAAGVTSYCGDGVTNGAEQCDDGNTTTEACAYGQTSCTVCDATCVSSAGATSYCGDGVTNGGEQCDDGNTATETCMYGQMSCTVCDATCANAPGATSYCGDGVVDPGNGEACDDGASNGSGPGSCNTGCTAVETACGNGVIEGSEQCDDGNVVTEVCPYGAASCTVCDASCTLVAGATSVCGDGAVDSSAEQCDDGNVVTEVCPYGAASCTVCDASCQLVAGSTTFCGDGVRQPNEHCDEGNNVLETCDFGETTCTVCNASCFLTTIDLGTCGDGVVDSLAGEECDDGDNITNNCPPQSLSPCTVCNAQCRNGPGRTALCGNGTVDAWIGETCDDGALNGSGPGNCNDSCSAVDSICGDGIVQGQEACDDGNDIIDVCPPGQSCTVCNSACELQARPASLCGNNTRDPGEQCDDGNHGVETCFYGTTSCFQCGQDCFMTPAPTTFCGDGVLDPAFEFCDDGPLNGTLGFCDSCVRVCGNGTVEVGYEDCDDGNTVTETCAYGETSCQVCMDFCYLVPGATSYCGDGAVDTANGEQCDDANTVTEACAYGETSCTVCNSTCASVAGQTAYCGDGILNGAEVCDAGAANGTPGQCNTTCEGTVPVCGDGVVGSGEACDDGNTITESCVYGQTSCTVCDGTCNIVAGATAYCGDAAVNGPEQCDDGNAATESCAYGETSCTVCDASCLTAAGTTTFCGDGMVDGPEACDDGNTVTESCPYGATSCLVCDASCLDAAGATSFCGDGTIDAANGEQCDDGNSTTEPCLYGQTSCTVCDAGCLNASGATTYCGDGAVDGIEECDDGNLANGDGCSDLCENEGPSFVDRTSVPAFSMWAPPYDYSFFGAVDDDVNTSWSVPVSGGAWMNVDFAGATPNAYVISRYSITNSTAGATSDPVAWDLSASADGASYTVIDIQNNVTFGGPSQRREFTIASPASYTYFTFNFVSGGAALEIAELELLEQVVFSCGDGVVSAGEQCDDGNTVTELCAYGQTSCTVCDGSCAQVSGVTSYCGDAAIDAPNGETCDDGVQNGTLGYCNVACNGPTPVCGDGVVGVGEDCDDGNTTSGDGCSSMCTSEAPVGLDRTSDPGFGIWAPPYDYSFYATVDDDAATVWSASTAGGLWMHLDLANVASPSAVIEAYTLTSGPNARANDPASWTLSASVDGNTWVVLDAQSGAVFSGPGQVLSFPVNNATAYTYFSFDFTANGGAQLEIAEIELLEFP